MNVYGEIKGYFVIVNTHSHMMYVQLQYAGRPGPRSHHYQVLKIRTFQRFWSFSVLDLPDAMPHRTYDVFLAWFDFSLH